MRCNHCFANDFSGSYCYHCGYVPEKDEGKYPLALSAGSVLAGQYLIGHPLGQGGFGITYIALDLYSNKRVAVKEYFPDILAARSGVSSVGPLSANQADDFAYGKDCFLKEAHTLAEFLNADGIVHIHSLFEENGTAYFVMDYVEGESFDAYINKNGGKISWDDAARVLLPVADALSLVHGKGIIHRDVTPDNIFITNDGKVKLLDFGAARYSLGDRSASLDVVLKHGYAPIEQYSQHGRQGPYTDVYALAATFYRAITGQKPPDSIDRMSNDTIVAPSALGAVLPHEAEQAIMRALEVQVANRTQTMAEFKAGIEGVVPVSAKPSNDPTYSVKLKNSFPKIIEDVASALEALAEQGVDRVRQFKAGTDGAASVPAKPVNGTTHSVKLKNKLPIIIGATAAILIISVIVVVLASGSDESDYYAQLSTTAAKETNASVTLPFSISDTTDSNEDDETASSNETTSPSQSSSSSNDDYVDSGSCGNNLTWTLDDDGILTVSGKGAMSNWDEDNLAGWSSYSDTIKKVVIESGVTSIGDCAFYGCTAVTSISLPSSVTSIGEFAFGGCTSLTDIAIPSGVTLIEAGAFAYCAKLSSITIPDGVTIIEMFAFFDCENLTYISISESATSIEYAVFAYCKSITSITIPKSVISIDDYAFAGCYDLETIYFEGDAPEFLMDEDNTDYSTFSGVTATAYYPAGNSTWTSSVRQDYGGDITWSNGSDTANVTFTAIEGTKGSTGESFENLFDDDLTTKWCVTKFSGAYVIWGASSPISITRYYIYTANDNEKYPGRNPSEWVLYGCYSSTAPSQDYSGWEVISIIENSGMEDVNYQGYYVDLSDVPEYNYFMLVIGDTTGATVMQISEFTLCY